MFQTILVEPNAPESTLEIIDVVIKRGEIVRGKVSYGKGVSVNVKGNFYVDGEDHVKYIDVNFPIACNNTEVEQRARNQIIELILASKKPGEALENSWSLDDLKKLKGRVAIFPAQIKIIPGSEPMSDSEVKAFINGNTEKN